MKYLAALIIASAVFIAGCGGSKVDRAQRTCEDSVMAFIMSTNFAKRELRSPSTAKFPTTNAPGVSSRYVGDCTHEIIGYVDAQNAFGATVRQYYTATMQNDYGTTTWRRLNLEFQR